jgi:Domain of unknown function (DUF4321)
MSSMLNERKTKGSLWIGLLVAFFSAVFGGIISTMLKHLIHGGIFHDLFVQGMKVGLVPPWTLDLGIMQLTFGFTLDLSLVAILCVVIGLLIYRKAA